MGLGAVAVGAGGSPWAEQLLPLGSQGVLEFGSMSQGLEDRGWGQAGGPLLW